MEMYWCQIYLILYSLSMSCEIGNSLPGSIYVLSILYYK